MIRLLAIALSLAVLHAANALGETTASLSPVADTTLSQTNPDTNSGLALTVQAGVIRTSVQGRHGLMRFDIAGNLPAGSVITSAALTLHAVQESGIGPVASAYDLYRASAPWVEGESTWNKRTTAGGTWGIPGGQAGVDYATVASASVDIAALGTYTWTGSGLAADAQAWLDNPSANHGWFLLSRSETVLATARGFASREDTGAAPVLQITYTAPVPEPSTLVLLGGALLAAAWVGVANGSRRMEQRILP